MLVNWQVFFHVIGSLWEVNDECCVDMAKITYEEMILKGMTDESVCLGLHKATRKLRDRWLRDMNVAAEQDTTKQDTTKQDTAEQAPAGIKDERAFRLLRKFKVCEPEETTEMSLYWVPYVHFGV